MAQIVCARIGVLLLSALRGTRSLKRVDAAQLNVIGLFAALKCVRPLVPQNFPVWLLDLPVGPWTELECCGMWC